MGSIPARAGEPLPRRLPAILSRVYPRPCGGTARLAIFSRIPWGLSPPVRGNRGELSGLWIHSGSIPARAGEPRARMLSKSAKRVYPRPCGGTRYRIDGPLYDWGLSPPVRGNPSAINAWIIPRGSIPARAGEPTARRVNQSWPRVYPRPCGGTFQVVPTRLKFPGLSPPVRGNRAGTQRGAGPRGSIPARAGEPSRTIRRHQTSRVYPRPCGGT